MAGQPMARAESLQDLTRAQLEREAMGFPMAPCGVLQGNGKPCPRNPIETSGYMRCGLHRFISLPSRKSAQQMAQEMREELAATLLPKSLAALDDVLSREDEFDEEGNRVTAAASDGDKIRAAGMVMDRAGLSPGADLRLVADVRVETPTDVLRAAFEGMAARMSAVIPGEVVESDSDAVEPAGG